MLFFSLMLFVYWRKYIWKTNHFMSNSLLILPFMQQLSNIMLLEVKMISFSTEEHKYVHVLYIVIFFILYIYNFFLLLSMFMWILGWFSYLTLIFWLQLLRENLIAILENISTVLRLPVLLWECILEGPDHEVFHYDLQLQDRCLQNLHTRVIFTYMHMSNTNWACKSGRQSRWNPALTKILPYTHSKMKILH